MWVFLDKFEESKENKLEYTEIFDQYTTFVESSLEKYLSSKISVCLSPHHMAVLYVTYLVVIVRLVGL